MGAVRDVRHPWVGHALVDRRGDRVGPVEAVLVDDATGTPAWAVVKAGLIGGAVVVPLAGAVASEGQLQADVDGRAASSSPSVDTRDGLHPGDESALRSHYGMAAGPRLLHGVPLTPAEQLTDGGWVVRSEEDVALTTTPAPSEVVRLTKRIVSEEVTFTVLVQREELVVERIPADVAGLDPTPVPDHPWAEGEVELVLYEERVVVDKVVVPRERVRVGSRVVQEERIVPVEVRSERIELEQEPAPPA